MYALSQNAVLMLIVMMEFVLMENAVGVHLMMIVTI